MNRWCNKVAVVTGASAGIGAAICIALANAGVQVVGLARRVEMVEKLQASVKGTSCICAMKCDVAKSSDIKAAFDWTEKNMGPISILVSNAGVLYNGLITDIGDKPCPEKDLLQTVDVNLKGPIICTKLAINCMKRHKIDGHIFTVNSILGHDVPFVPNLNVYAVTKHGVTAFHKALATELAHYKSKIRTTSLSPGLVVTDLASPIIDGTRPTLQPKDIAAGVIFALATPAHVNITELTIEPVSEPRI